MAFTIYNQGSFASTGVGVSIPVEAGADYFKTINMTQLATTQATGRACMCEWYGNPSFAADTSINWTKTNSTNGMNLSLASSGGFTYVQSFPQPEAAFTGTAITNASPAVASGFTSLPYVDGDTVVLYATTGMLQIGGALFTVSSTSSTGFTLKGLPAATFSAPATAVTARRVSKYQPVLPEFLYISNITKASQAVVTVTQDPTNVVFVGQKLVFQIPSSFGMTELNNTNSAQSLPAVVVSVDAANYKFTINVNSTNFTTFAWPASTASPTAPLFATVAPAGCSTQYDPSLQTYTGYNFNLQPFRSSQLYPYMYLAAGAQSPAGSIGDTIVWQYGKMEAPAYGTV